MLRLQPSDSFPNDKPIYKLLKSKRYTQNIWSKELMHKKPFAFQIAHNGYLLMSCPGQLK